MRDYARNCGISSLRTNLGTPSQKDRIKPVLLFTGHPKRSGLEQFALSCVCYCLETVMRPQLLIDVVEVVPESWQGYALNLRDFGRVSALRKET